MKKNENSSTQTDQFSYISLLIIAASDFSDIPKRSSDKTNY